MSESNIKHHYIPQCYLKHFSKDHNLIYVYNKKSNTKGYPKSISKIAYIDNLYAIDDDFIKFLKEDKDLPVDEINKNFIEIKIFAEQIEKLYSEILNNIKSSFFIWKTKNNFKEILNNKDRNYFAQLIAIQYLRLPNVKKEYWDFYKKAEQGRLEMAKMIMMNSKDQLIIENRNFLESINIEFKESYASTLHLDLYLDDEITGEIQKSLLKKYWLYYYSDKPVFFTSDNPIVFKQNLPNEKSSSFGFNKKGVEILFPISSKILIAISDEEYFPEKKSLNNTFIKVTAKQIREFNSYQYIFSNEETYSEINDFKLIHDLKKANGYQNKEIRINKPQIKTNGK